MILQMEALASGASLIPHISSSSTGQSQHEVAESTPKLNSGNQDRSQQETNSSTSDSISTVKDPGRRKIPPDNQSSESGQLHRTNIRLEESLKEKAGFPLHSHKHHLPSSQRNNLALEGKAPTRSIKSSMKSTPSEQPSESATLHDSESLLYSTRERRMLKSGSDWSEQQSVADTSKSGKQLHV